MKAPATATQTEDGTRSWDVNMTGISVDECKRAQRQCREGVDSRIEAAISVSLTPVMSQLARIEAHSENTSQKLEGLVALNNRVAALELWKAQLNGHAKAIAESQGSSLQMQEIRNSIQDALQEAVVNVQLKTRKTDYKWWLDLKVVAAVLGAIGALGATIIVLAAYAGPKALPSLPWYNTKANTSVTTTVVPEAQVRGTSERP